jgi:exodeoxyribonuclease-3
LFRCPAASSASSRCTCRTATRPARRNSTTSSPGYPDNWKRDALFQPETRAAYRRILNLGLTDAFRACEGGDGHYTFWDYQAGSWQKNNGIRIDHMLLSPQATDRLANAIIDKRTRGWEKPSDHVPVVIELDV